MLVDELENAEIINESQNVSFPAMRTDGNSGLAGVSEAHSDRTCIAMSAAERPSAGMLTLENRYIKVPGSKLDRVR